jgi:hypothetical protein
MFVESVITLLIYVCLLVLCAYLVIYVLGALGVALPPKVVQIIWIIVMLIVVLMIVRMLLSGLIA